MGYRRFGRALRQNENYAQYFLPGLYIYAAEWQAIGCQPILSGQIFPSKEDKGVQKGQD